MFGKEPTVVLGAVSEVIRQIIPMLIIFGILHWTGEQVAQVMAVVSAIIAALTIILTRSQVTPETKVNDLIRTAVDQPAGTPVSKVKEIQERKDETK